MVEPKTPSHLPVHGVYGALIRPARLGRAVELAATVRKMARYRAAGVRVSSAT